MVALEVDTNDGYKTTKANQPQKEKRGSAVVSQTKGIPTSSLI
jgi:23S rRNA A2030 N6-methylase RlmJ